jgi:hypothetical protein
VAGVVAAALSLVAISYFLIACLMTSRSQMLISTCLMGFSSYPAFFISYELVVGLSPGIGEAMSCGILNTYANAGGFIVILVATFYLSTG